MTILKRLFADKAPVRSDDRDAENARAVEWLKLNRERWLNENWGFTWRD